MVDIIPDGMKRCSKGEQCCAQGGAIQPTNNFCKDAKNKDGKSNRCNSCAHAVHKEWMKNPDNRKKHNIRVANNAAKPQNRFIKALRNSIRWALIHGHAPCSATVEEIAAAHDERCHGCGRLENTFPKKLSLDHNHDTGQFRGWLCKGCNIAVGETDDSSSRLRSLADYLDRPR
jgi:hypothetical protein